MPPKGKKSGGGKDKAGEEREDPLQAVVFADSYETRFYPFTLEQPRCLLPLANTPLIEYTLEFLASVGVEEVFLYCGNHTDTVEAYLQNSRWMHKTSPFALQVLRSDSRSIGDCMRDLDQKDLIVGDFLCVYGDVVANVPLERALAAHRARREKDKKSIMTMVLREASGEGGSVARHRTNAQPVRSVFVLDAEKQRCVHYEQIQPGKSAKLDIPGEVLQDAVELEIREDLIDCGIDICTPEVLAQYTDNFDWQLPRRGFLRGMLKDYETFQLMVHTHVVKQGYAARVKNLAAYDAISRDVVSRWTYPYTPDANFVDGQSYRLSTGNVHREVGAVLARSSVTGNNTVIGAGTVVGERTIITNSVIGRRCTIGSNVKIHGAYVWDGARIGNGSSIDTAIVANEATIGDGCQVEKNALISYGARISKNTTISGDRRVTKHKRKRDSADTHVTAHTDAQVVGEDGEGYHLELDEEEEEVVEALLSNMQHMDLTVDNSDDDMSTFSNESEDSDAGSASAAARSTTRSDSFTSIASDDSGDAAARHSASDFYHEAVTSIFDALQRSQRPEDIQLELRALALANNADGKHVRRSIAVAFAKRIANLMEESGASPKDAVTEVIPPYKSLIKAYVKGEEEQAEFLLFLQTDLVHRPQGEKVLLFASNALATQDLCEAEGFERWWKDERSSASEELRRVRKETEQLVEVLVGDDEEDDDEEEDDEDEESE